MFGWSQVAPVLPLLAALAAPFAPPALCASPAPLAHPQLAPVQRLAGAWSCRLGASALRLRISERHARPDQPSTPVEAFTVDWEGTPAERLGLKPGLITFDPKDRQLHIDADGKCTLPGPIEDDDDPDTGVQRCLRMTGSSRAVHGNAQRWSLSLTRPNEKARRLQLELRPLAVTSFDVTLRSGARTLARGRCTRDDPTPPGASAHRL